MLKPCATRGCPELVERGSFHCPTHAPAPWARAQPRQHDVSRKVWERMRRQVIRRAGGRCERCGQPGRDVNHKIPLAHGGPTEMGDLELLCVDCHRADTAAIRRQR